MATTGDVTFTDRDVADAKDGYVCCESYVEKKEFRHMSVMEKGIQVSWEGYFATEAFDYSTLVWQKIFCLNFDILENDSTGGLQLDFAPEMELFYAV